jgi:hypothetical protein
MVVLLSHRKTQKTNFMRAYLVLWKEKQDVLGKIINLNFTNSKGTKFRSILRFPMRKIYEK